MRPRWPNCDASAWCSRQRAPGVAGAVQVIPHVTDERLFHLPSGQGGARFPD